MQGGWCDSIGSVEEIQVKLLKRQEAAAKRERAMAYALTHQVSFCKNKTSSSKFILNKVNFKPCQSKSNGRIIEHIQHCRTSLFFK